MGRKYVDESHWSLKFRFMKLKLFLSYFYHFLRFGDDQASQCRNILTSRLPVLLALPARHERKGSNGRTAWSHAGICRNDQNKKVIESKHYLIRKETRVVVPFLALSKNMTKFHFQLQHLQALGKKDVTLETKS